MRRLLLILCLGAVTVHARIGENREALIKRFGTPLPAKRIGDESTMIFEKDGFRITCSGMGGGGKCAQEDYQMISGEALTEKQVDHMLWQVWGTGNAEELEAEGDARWWRKKGTYFEQARLGPDKKVLTFGSGIFGQDREKKPVPAGI